MAGLKAGSTVNYSANVSVSVGIPFITAIGSLSNLENAVRSGAAAKAATVGNYILGELGGGEYNIQANIFTNIDRNSINDLKADIDNAIRAISSVVVVRASAIRIIANPGQNAPPIQQDTFHDKDTVLGTAGSFWFDQIGQQLTGAVKALSEGSPMMWLGIGVVALIIFNKK